MEGISKQIKQNIGYYDKLTESKLQDVITSIFKSRTTSSAGPSYILLTGFHGMLDFDFTMKYGDIVEYKHFYNAKRNNVTVRSLYSKEGPLKLVTVGQELQIRMGTKIVFRGTTAKEINDYLKEYGMKER